jgi:BioD-like phosphotransacetylase family protein
MPGGMLITGMGETSGKSLVTIGLLRDAAERCAHIGLLRPITSASTSGESRIVTLAERLLPEGALSTAAVLTAAEAEDLIAAGRAEEVIDRVLAAWGRLADECDLVIVEGTGAIRGAVPGEPDVNIALARHLDVPVVAVVDGHGRTPERIATRVRMVRRTVAEAHATLLAVVVNRVAEAGVERTRALIPTGTLGRPVPVLPYAAPLTWPSVAEIADAIGATRVGGGGDVDHLVRRITVAAMEVDHALSVIGAGSLVVVPADRGEVIRGILAAPSPQRASSSAVTCTSTRRPPGRSPPGACPSTGSPRTPSPSPRRPGPSAPRSAAVTRCALGRRCGCGTSTLTARRSSPASSSRCPTNSRPSVSRSSWPPAHDVPTRASCCPRARTTASSPRPRTWPAAASSTRSCWASGTPSPGGSPRSVSPPTGWRSSTRPRARCMKSWPPLCTAPAHTRA